MNQETTILYVDDEPLNLMLFEISFRRHYKVITANSGSEGLDKLKSNPHIAVTISDMKMPGMNGLEFITRAKSDFPGMAYFILTGFDISEEIAEALRNNLIVNYFRKPFNVKEIVDSVESTRK